MSTDLARTAPADIQPRPEAPALAVSETAAILSMIERLAKDPNVDIDRVERMMALHREMRTEKAREDFNRAMAAVQAELPQVRRDALNDHTKSKYARLETISAKVDPIIARHGLSLSYSTESSAVPNHYKVVCIVALGSYERRFELDTPADGVGSAGKANKTAVQAMGSTISYARRYLKLMIFDIALTNEDNDGNRVVDEPRRDPQPERQARPAARSDAPVGGPPRITAEQAERLRDAIHDIGETEASFCRSVKLSAIAALHSDDFDAAMAFVAKAGGSK